MCTVVWLQNNGTNQYFQPYYFSHLGPFHTSFNFLHLYLHLYTFRWESIYFFEWYAVEGDHTLSRFMASSAGSSSHLLTRLDASSTPSRFVLLQSQLRFRAVCTHRSYQTMFGLRGVCFSQLGPAGGHFEGLWQRFSSSFSHKGANCPHVVALLWSSHLERIWTPGPTWWGCNCCLTVIARPLTGWKHGLFFFPFLLSL